MRGQRLFVRPIEPSDRDAVSAFLTVEDGRSLPSSMDGQDCLSATPVCGLLGKLLGDIVAIVVIEITPDALVIENVVVARELRRERVGRAMMREVEQLAAKMDRRRVVVDDAGGAHEFFRRVGFVSEGDGWVRLVS